jgi:hypothetical protein
VLIKFKYLTFLKIFENDVSAEIGLKLDMLVLLPILYSGLTTENFNQLE